MKQITVPSGIGDNIWILQKLINAEEKFNFILPGNIPQRGKQIFDLLPEIGTAEYNGNIPFREIKRLNKERPFKYWRTLSKFNTFFLEANTHLENGNRIEQFLPDLPTTYKFNWVTTAAEKEYALQTFTKKNKYIGIYTSAYSTQRSWGFWDEQKWFDLIKLCGKDYTYVIIGALWDKDLTTGLMALLTKHKYKFINTVGETLGTVIETMKNLHYFFSFPSGLGILATTINCPVTMFYPEHLKLMINAWASRDDIELGSYKGCLFCEPDEIYKWCKENKWV